MAETEGTSKVSEANRPPTIALPPRSSLETLFPGGAGWSPGPLTIVSSFFSDQNADGDCRSFSQLLAGAMASPAAALPGAWPSLVADGDSKKETKSGDGVEKSLGFRQNRPVNLVVPLSPLFMLPPGLSPTGLLSSPGFFSPVQSPFRMSHQQALAHVTAQAALSQSCYNFQTENKSSLAESPEQQQMSAVWSEDLEGSRIDSPEVSHFDKRPLPTSLPVVDKPDNDGYNWRKYGQKQVKASKYPRSYYKCTHNNCPVKKKVGRSLDGRISDIIYKGQHNHEPPKKKKLEKESSEVAKNHKLQTGYEARLQGQQEPSLSEEAVGSVPLAENTRASPNVIELDEKDDSIIRLDEEANDGPNPKRRNTEVGPYDLIASSHQAVTEPKIVVQTRSEVDLLDDGFKWRKYGQKVVKGNPNPRSYYKCTFMGCNVRKHVERSSTDPKSVVTTYEGKHNHDIPLARSRKEVNLGKDQKSVFSQLKEEQIIA